MRQTGPRCSESFWYSQGQFLDPPLSRLARRQRRSSRLAHVIATPTPSSTSTTAIKSFQSLRPVAVLGDACVGATLTYESAVEPAGRLRAELAQHGAWFAVIGVAMSLVAAQWISAPVRRLAQSARKLQSGRFERPIPVARPVGSPRARPRLQRDERRPRRARRQGASRAGARPRRRTRRKTTSSQRSRTSCARRSPLSSDGRTCCRPKTCRANGCSTGSGSSSAAPARKAS